MILRLLCLLLLLSSGFQPAPVHAEEDLGELRTQLGNEWQLTRHDQRRHIKTYARLEDGKRYRSFRVEAELNTRVEHSRASCSMSTTIRSGFGIPESRAC